jgi:hypothetical protein
MGYVYLSYFLLALLIHLRTDAIVKVFPWYMQMHKLMGTSPVIDRSAMANSNTPLNLAAIMHGHQDRNGASDDDSVKVMLFYHLLPLSLNIGV